MKDKPDNELLYLAHNGNKNDKALAILEILHRKEHLESELMKAIEIIQGQRQYFKIAIDTAFEYIHEHARLLNDGYNVDKVEEMLSFADNIRDYFQNESSNQIDAFRADYTEWLKETNQPPPPPPADSDIGKEGK